MEVHSPPREVVLQIGREARLHCQRASTCGLQELGSAKRSQKRSAFALTFGIQTAGDSLSGVNDSAQLFARL